MAQRKRKKEEWLMPGPLDMGRPALSPKRYVDLFTQTTPDIDLIDEGSSFRIRADLPGVRKEDIRLKVSKYGVTISSATQKAEERKGKNYYYSERAESSYFRSVPLPSAVLSRTAAAKYENGTLEITVRKEKPKREGNEVKVG